MQRLILTILAVSIFIFPAPAKAAEISAQPKVISGKTNIYEWFPPNFGPGKKRWPLVLFSHGLGGCGVQSKFLMEALAAHGYVVAAPDHADASCGRSYRQAAEDADSLESSAAGRRGLLGLRRNRHRPQERLGDPEAWTADTYRDRAEDMRYTLETVLRDPDVGPFIDRQRIGLSGHSLGGYTVLGLAGGWPSWKDTRFRAVLALSPYANPYAKHDTLKNIDIPVMYQTGTRDMGVKPFLTRSGGAYDQTPAPKYLVEFTGTGHFGFSDLVGNRHDAMNDYAVAFFDKYLKGEDSGFLEQKAGQAVASYRANP